MTDIILAIFYGPHQKSVWLQILTAVILLVGMGVAWRVYGGLIGAEDRYEVRPECIWIENPPDWVPATFVKESLGEHPDFQGRRIGLLDAKLAVSLAKAFEVHPWVNQVESVSLEYPAKVQVRIDFRKPVAVVSAPAEHYPEFKDGGFLVDASGNLLPGDYFQAHPEHLNDYIWIEGISSVPMGSYGEPWNDPLVSESAILAELLRAGGTSLQLKKMIVSAKEEQGIGGRYELETRRGTRIVWGDFPIAASLAARDLPNSPERFARIKTQVLARQEPKVAYLRYLVGRYGSLDLVPGDQKPIDLTRVAQDRL